MISFRLTCISFGPIVLTLIVSIFYSLPWSQSFFLPCTKNSWTKSRKLLTWNSHDYGGALDHLGWYLVGLKCLDESAWMSDETLPIKIWRKLDQPRNNWMHYASFTNFYYAALHCCDVSWYAIWFWGTLLNRLQLIKSM